MIDIVARLRSACYCFPGKESCKLCTAADTIEALTTERDGLHKKVQELYATRDSLLDAISSATMNRPTTIEEHVKAALDAAIDATRGKT